MTENPSRDTATPQELRQLDHDIRGYLAIISLGLEALKGVREEPEQFATMIEAIRQDGVEPLKKVVIRFARLAAESPE